MPADPTINELKLSDEGLSWIRGQLTWERSLERLRRSEVEPAPVRQLHDARPGERQVSRPDQAA